MIPQLSPIVNSYVKVSPIIHIVQIFNTFTLHFDVHK